MSVVVFNYIKNMKTAVFFIVASCFVIVLSVMLSQNLPQIQSDLFTILIFLCGIVCCYFGIMLTSRDTQMPEKNAATNPVNAFSHKLFTAQLSLLTVWSIVLLCQLISVDLLQNEALTRAAISNLYFGLFCTMYSFMAFGAFFADIVQKLNTPVKSACLIVLAFYIISLFSKGTQGEIIRYFTPFLFFSYSNALSSATFELTGFLLSIIFILLFFVFSYIRYKNTNRR